MREGWGLVVAAQSVAGGGKTVDRLCPSRSKKAITGDFKLAAPSSVVRPGLML